MIKKNILIVFALVAILLVSCSKDSVLEQNGIGTVVIDLAGTQYAASEINKLGTTDRSVTSNMYWDEDYVLEVSIKTSKKNSVNKLASTGVISNDILDTGVEYRLLVFDTELGFISSHDYIVGQTNHGVSLETSRRYNFIIYSFGEAQPLPALSLTKGDELNKALLELQTLKDVMASVQLNTSLKTGENNINIVLKHLFSKVEFTLDASAVGDISSYGDLNITNSFSKSTLNLGQQSVYPANISFIDKIDQKILNPFKSLDGTKILQSEATMLYANGSLTNQIILNSLTIGSVTRSNLLLAELVVKPGVSYEIEVKLKSSKAQGFEIGNTIWSVGNLSFNNGTYYFAETQGEYGNYWYRNEAGNYYLDPFPGMGGQGFGEGEIVINVCEKVGAGWRLPTSQESKNLETFSNWYGNPTNKFVGTYKKKDGTNANGVFFGIGTQPTAETQDSYLFLPFAGAYNTLSAQEIGQSGFYWHTGKGLNNEGTSLQIANYISPTNNGGLDSRRANSIRCVRDK